MGGSMGRIQVAALSLSAMGLIGIAAHEGYRDVAYTPVPGDRLTIGFGDAQGVREGQRTDPVRALIRLGGQVSQFERELKACVGDVPMHQSEWDALVSITLNIGSNQICRSTLVRKLKAGDYAGSCREYDRWVYFQGRVLPGLVKRRAEERALCESQH
jgi:lysozyme